MVNALETMPVKTSADGRPEPPKLARLESAETPKTAVARDVGYESFRVIGPGIAGPDYSRVSTTWPGV
jgi:hypothetical protein